MSIYIGNNKYKEIYLGSNKISEVYLGSNKIYESSVVPPGPQDEVTIGNQIWKNKNLSIDDGQGGIYTQTVNYGQGNVVEYYYTWAAAIRIANSISGWHLPTTSEWNTLAEAVGGSSVAGTKLKSTYGWTYGTATDNYGFSAFPAGYRTTSEFKYLGTYARFWTATEYSSSSAYCCYYLGSRNISPNAAQTIDNNRKTYSLSVRLVKDI